MPLNNITGRDSFIIAKALCYAIETMECLPERQRESGDCDDMRRLLARAVNSWIARSLDSSISRLDHTLYLLHRGSSQPFVVCRPRVALDFLQAGVARNRRDFVGRATHFS